MLDHNNLKSLVLGPLMTRKPERQANGQTIKCHNVLALLEHASGATETIDTSRPLVFLGKLAALAFRPPANLEHVALLPGRRGLRTWFPLAVFVLLLAFRSRNRTFPPRLTYFVVGGWLPTVASGRIPLVRYTLSKLDLIAVETRRMRDELVAQGLFNVQQVRNFRSTIPSAITTKDTLYSVVPPVRFVYLSRITPTKGPLRAIHFLEELRRRGLTTILDFYGPVDADYENFWSMVHERDWVNHQGEFRSSEVMSIAIKYHFHILLTDYPGEGIPGTIVEAMAAGVPSITTDWLDLHEAVLNNTTGFLLSEPQCPYVINRLLEIAASPREYHQLVTNCLSLAQDYTLQAACSDFQRALGRPSPFDRPAVKDI